MGVYIGRIEKKVSGLTTWFNFKPIAEVKGNRVDSLSQADQTALLPESLKRDINFSYRWDDPDELAQMEELFANNSLTVFEFVLSDLHDNTSPRGDRNKTGYIVNAMEMIEAGKIRPIETVGVYYAVRKQELVSDFTNDKVVDIDTPNVGLHDQVFVELDDFWAGPYEVNYRPYNYSYYIKPQIKENKYTVNGYNNNNMMRQELFDPDAYWDDTRWTIVIPKQDAQFEQLDVITPEALLEGFRDSLVSNTAGADKANILEDIPSLLKHYEESVLAGAGLADHIQRNRLYQIFEILTAEEKIDETLGLISDSICDLLIRYKDTQSVEEWLYMLLQKHPDLIQQFADAEAITVRIAQAQRELTDLTQQLSDLNQEKVELQKEFAEKHVDNDAMDQAIDQAVVEERTKELLKKDAEYTNLCNQIETIQKKMGIVASIDNLQKMQNDFKREVVYLEEHKKHLTQETSSLELQFQQLIKRSHEDMVGIAFDGYMASKMLNAAAEWEAEEAKHQHESLMEDINAVPAADKTPEELLEYLCSTIKIVRPTYDKNTIVNIAICLTQGFLTVFSGEPGCGKTSICDIFGEVLGLNKICEYVNSCDDNTDSAKRYVSVSVEKGWTSKRDFVGYYNPLSKTFDKSNRRVYDALHQLDTEKKKGICKFPYVILLDEANLSPMEYYWSDFMNICDDLNDKSKVNLGEDYVFAIPETLHFVATVNNDHTVEPFSPRLIDRAWIVMLPLPQQYNAASVNSEIPADNIEIITWQSLHNAFIPKKEDIARFVEVQPIYDSILAKLKEQRILVSRRVDMAIKQYWASASKHFEMDETKTDANTVALDYAIAQRVLPKIEGNGDAFEKWLDELKRLCSGHGLNRSAKILKDIIDQGNRQMKYYRFFYY